MARQRRRGLWSPAFTWTRVVGLGRACSTDAPTGP
jgi:hypothetical protein